MPRSAVAPLAVAPRMWARRKAIERFAALLRSRRLPVLRHLSPCAASLRQADRDRLFPARHFLAGAAASQRSGLALVHGSPDLVGGLRSVPGHGYLTFGRADSDGQFPRPRRPRRAWLERPGWAELRAGQSGSRRRRCSGAARRLEQPYPRPARSPSRDWNRAARRAS